MSNVLVFAPLAIDPEVLLELSNEESPYTVALLLTMVLAYNNGAKGNCGKTPVLKEYLNWNVNTIEKARARLRKKGYIGFLRDEGNRTQWFMDLRAKERSGSPKSPFSGDPTLPTRTTPPLGGGTTRGSGVCVEGFGLGGVNGKNKKLPGEITKLTDQLVDTLSGTVKGFRRPTNKDRTRWGKALHKLTTADNPVPVKDLERMVQWYGKHAGERYVPRIRTGVGFAQEYDRLEAARDRAKEAVTAPEGKKRNWQRGDVNKRKDGVWYWVTRITEDGRPVWGKCHNQSDEGRE